MVACPRRRGAARNSRRDAGATAERAPSQLVELLATLPLLIWPGFWVGLRRSLFLLLCGRQGVAAGLSPESRTALPALGGRRARGRLLPRFLCLQPSPARSLYRTGLSLLSGSTSFFRTAAWTA